MKRDLSYINDPRRYNDLFYPLLNSDARRIILYGSRNSAKSYFIGQKSIRDCLTLPYYKGVLIRRHFNTIRDSIYSRIKSVTQDLLIDDLFEFKRSPLEIIGPNGNSFIARGMDNAEKAKSLDDPTHIIYEEADQISEKDYDTMSLSLRNSKGIKPQEILIFNSGDPEHWIVKRFFPDVKSFEKIDGSHTYIETNDPELVIVHAAWFHNDFIDEWSQKEHLNLKAKNLQKYRVHSLGLFGIEVEGALWTQKNINQHRVFTPPEMRKIVVGFDPAVSSNELSDEHGIIGAGFGQDERGYVLDDDSGKSTPVEAAQKAIAMYHKLKADAIVIEKNNGGDWIPAVFKNIDPSVKTITVHASRGKRTRAEPISTVYEAGNISHVGYLPKLESELTTWLPLESRDSPNRLDALVWALSEFFVKKQRKMRIA